MYEILFNIHRFNRYIVLIALIALIINSGMKFFKQQPFGSTDNKLSLIALISTHIQLVVGLILYTQSPLVMFNAAAIRQSHMIRYYTAEHISLMLIAILFITVGRIVAKKRIKQVVSGNKPAYSPHKMLLIFNLIGLVIILVSLNQNKIIL